MQETWRPGVRKRHPQALDHVSVRSKRGIVANVKEAPNPVSSCQMLYIHSFKHAFWVSTAGGVPGAVGRALRLGTAGSN